MNGRMSESNTYFEMIQLFSIRMIRPVSFGYEGNNHVLSLYKKDRGVTFIKLTVFNFNIIFHWKSAN